MPNGYSDAKGIFTEMLIPPFEKLQNQGYISILFIDYSLLQGSTRDKCLENLHETPYFLTALEFTIHKEKSVLEPTRCIGLLGFVINSVDTTVEINPIKGQLNMKKIKNFLDHKKPTTKQLASAIGSCISLFPALLLGKLHYRNLEKEKTKVLKLHQANFNSNLATINAFEVQELH